MDKRLNNLIITESGEGLKYKPISQGPGKKNYPARDSRAAHGNRIKSQFELAWKKAEELCENKVAVSASSREGVYLQIKGKEGYDLITQSLEDSRQGVRLSNVQIDDKGVICATVFVPNEKHDFLIKKIKKYMETENGTDVIGTIENIQAAMIDAMWIGNKKQIPKETAVWCEVWLRYSIKDDVDTVKEEFLLLCQELHINTKRQHIVFPERMVVGAFVAFKQLLLLLEYSPRIAEFRKMVTPTSFFSGLTDAEQREWSSELKERINVENLTQTSVCLLDTGINNGHPVLEKIVKDSDRHTVEYSRGVDDKVGHGTNMAGIAAYFTLEDKLDSMDAVNAYHFIESVKMMDKSDDNPEELYGELSSEAISLAEIENPNINRVICMAITAESDNIKDGRPSSWSGAIDAVVSGANEENSHRLMLISAGNTTLGELKENENYQSAVINHSVENPGQAWNALTVGAFTELDNIEDPIYTGYEPIVQAGDISPYTSSSLSWDHSKWPIKPEILLEGGNVAYSKKDDFFTEADDLSLLTTGHQYLLNKPFDVIRMTSSATAQASWMAARIWGKYPDLWPETVRALLIHSSDWTKEMVSSICGREKLAKGDYRKLLRICGYGVPNLERAMWSASNSVNLIVQDELQPFIKKKDGSITANEMHIHTLPWPKDLLRDYEDTAVKMRVTLSYFIEPGPGEIGWRDKYRYPSCGLRFDVNNPTEDRENFTKRISKAMREDENDKNEVKNDSNRWLLGANNRNVGSIHSDIWEGTASQLSESNLIIIYPKSGWWKSRANLKKYHARIRYSLVVSIEAPEIDIDLYTAIKTEIKNKSLIKTEITAL